ncbi:ABC transporter substrate-binding protein [Nocardioides deserti]|uniref:ABC transporter substrate-binding protein n=1 Tax=Nocardioides deserti TaxID=1588644 RepID=A0ABR6UCP1_9ACTN|nr:ABC transporter substrate-binding protein [Nocardioides deserti]MBC2961734.1 ABC transporter substrate-binding protein [Nocardioides deserti]GGO73100.1 ABC transporter substrate-binding protein [Nocardioides deserti]
MRGPKLRVSLVGAAALTLALAGCSASNPDDGDGGSAADDTLVIAAVNVPGGFDGDVITPGTQHTVTQIYEPLVNYGVRDVEGGAREVDASVIEPGLAESWEVADDELSVTFKLREGVESQWGNELTAEDVKWSWDKSLDQERTGAFIASVSNVESVEVVDTYEVRFNLTDPSPILLKALTLYTPSIYDSTEMKKHATKDDPWALEWIVSNSAGFGPYYVDEVKAGEEAVFKANPNYYGDEPHFSTVVYRSVPDASTRVQLLQAGSVDWIEELTFTQLNELETSDGVKVQSTPGNFQARALMNPNYEPFKDKRVRQAINFATPHEQILNNVFAGRAQQSRGPLVSTIPCYNSDAWAYETDVDRAKSLLADAGYANGVDITLEYSGLNWWEEPLGIQLKDGLAKAGIRVSLKRIPDADMTARAAITERDLPFFTFYEQSIVLDPGYSMLLTSTPDGSADRNDYDNPEVTKLIEQANVITDEEKRCELIDEAQQIHLEDASWIYSAEIGAHEAMAEDIEGWVWHPDNHERWADLSR